jgi:hypothetical protein
MEIGENNKIKGKKKNNKSNYFNQMHIQNKIKQNSPQ